MSKRRITKKQNHNKTVSKAIIHIMATFNNTNITVTDDFGNTLCWATSGSLGFKGSKKSTPYAAQQAVEAALMKAKEYGIKEVGVRVQGPGGGREAAIKSISSFNSLKVLWFKDVTPLPHNGCRPPKRRRV